MSQPRTSVPGVLLLLSGCCALVYQVAWLRELRLVFGASTSANAAVLAIFMGGLGLGGLLLGRSGADGPNSLREAVRGDGYRVRRHRHFLEGCSVDYEQNWGYPKSNHRPVAVSFHLSCFRSPKGGDNG